MLTTLSRLPALALLAALIGLAGCKKPRTQKEAPPEPKPAAPAPEPEPEPEPGTDPPVDEEPPTDRPAGDVSLTMLTPPGLEGVGETLAQRYTEVTGIEVDVTSGPLLQLLKGLDDSGGDVLLTEGFGPVETMRAAGVVEAKTARPVTWLPLTITVAGSKAETVRTPADMDREGFRLGVPDPSRSTAGAAARRLLRRAGIGERLQERILPAGATSALRDDTVDAFISWGSVRGVGVPMTLPAHLREHLPVVATLIQTSDTPDAASAFMKWLDSPAAGQVWAQAGTQPTLPTGSPTLATELPIRLTPPRRFMGCAVVGDRVLVAGGEAAGERLSNLTWFEPAAVRTEESEAKLPSAREGAAAVWVADVGRVIIAGGKTDAGLTDEIVAYDPEADALTPIGLRLPAPVTGASADVRGSTVTLFGGEDPEGKTAQVVQLDLSANTVNVLPAVMPTPRTHVAAAPGEGGRVWFYGGLSEIGGLAEIAVYEAANGVVNRRPERLPAAVRGARAVPSDGGFLIIGGETRHGPIDTIDRHTPDGPVRRLPLRLPYPVAYGCAATIGDTTWILGGLSDTRVEGRITRLPF